MPRIDGVRFARAVLILVAIGCVPARVAAQPPQDYTTWLNARIDSVVAARIQQRSNTNQTQAPSASSSGMSLVDRTSAADLFGISVNLPNQPGAEGSESRTTAYAFTATPYVLWALLKGSGPLDPSFYLGSDLARRFGLSVTFDQEDRPSDRLVTVISGKVLLLDRGNLLDTPQRDAVREALRQAADAYRELSRSIQDLLWEEVGEERGATRVEFINSLNQGAVLAGVLDALAPDDRRAIDRMIERAIGEVVSLRDAVRESVLESRRRPELSLAFTSRLVDGPGDELMASLVFDYQARDRLELTLNAGFLYMDAPIPTGEDDYGAEVAGQLALQLSPDDALVGRDPMTFSVAGSGRWSTELDPLYRLQAKLAIPIVEGVHVPVSVTWASRTELIDEAEVRGLVGFTLDTSRVLSSLR